MPSFNIPGIAIKITEKSAGSRMSIQEDFSKFHKAGGGAFGSQPVWLLFQFIGVIQNLATPTEFSKKPNMGVSFGESPQKMI